MPSGCSHGNMRENWRVSKLYLDSVLVPTGRFLTLGTRVPNISGNMSVKVPGPADGTWGHAVAFPNTFCLRGLCSRGGEANNANPPPVRMELRDK